MQLIIATALFLVGQTLIGPTLTPALGSIGLVVLVFASCLLQEKLTWYEYPSTFWRFFPQPCIAFDGMYIFWHFPHDRKCSAIRIQWDGDRSVGDRLLTSLLFDARWDILVVWVPTLSSVNVALFDYCYIYTAAIVAMCVFCKLWSWRKDQWQGTVLASDSGLLISLLSVPLASMVMSENQSLNSTLLNKHAF